MTHDIWGTIKEQLKATLGENNYTTWIEPVGFGGFDDGMLTLTVPTNFVGNYVDQNYSDIIMQIVKRAGHGVRRVFFTVKPGSHSAPMQAKPRKAHVALKPKSQGMFEAAPLDPKFTFGSFVVGKPNTLAYSAARRAAEGGPIAFNPLFVYGGVGFGKTHLLHAIAWEIQERQPEANVLFLSAEQFMFRFVQAIRERRMMDFKEMFRSVDVLIVDDFQFIAGKDSTQEEFFHTFNALIGQNKQIIISAIKPPSDIKNLDERVKSRLQSGLLVDLQATDYELRLGVLQSKAQVFKDSDPSVVWHDGVLEFVAQRLKGSARELEGAVNRLYAFSSLVKRDIDMELTREALLHSLKAAERKVTVEEIQRETSEHYNIRLADLIGPKRVRNFARPRQVAMYLCKQMTTRSLPEIGRRFGGRDHTTIMHGVRRIEELRQKDQQIDEDVEMLRRKLEG